MRYEESPNVRLAKMKRHFTSVDSARCFSYKASAHGWSICPLLINPAFQGEYPMPLHINSKRLDFSLVVVATLSLLLTSGCSKSGGNSLHLNSPATGDKDIAVKSFYAYGVIQSFS